jgi:nucleotide-binding universal stress UspA family protein
MTIMDRPDWNHNEFRDMPLRVLFVVHGHETAEWTLRACRLVSELRDARVRLLAVANIRCPSLTSLISPTRRPRAEAQSAWSQNEEQRVEQAVDRVLRTLSRQIEVVRDRPSARGVVGTIVEHAMDWAADLVVCGAPIPMAKAWVWPGPVHERVLRGAACAVLAIPPVTWSWPLRV